MYITNNLDIQLPLYDKIIFIFPSVYPPFLHIYYVDEKCVIVSGHL